MRVLFWGTPDFAVPSLRALVGEGHHVVGVVTQPDRPAGRGRRLRASAVREVAIEEGVPVLTPERPRGESFLSALRALDPEISVVVAYGHILAPEVLELPREGSINVHASLLPELRGAAPVAWAVARGHDRTGVSIMQMTPGMDEGPLLLQRETPIGADETASGLYRRLSELGAEAVVEALVLLEAGGIEPQEQDHARATYAPKVGREVARIDWSRTAREVANHIRGMDEVPGAWTTLDGEPLKFFRPSVLAGASEAPAGTVDAMPGTAEALPGTVLQSDPDIGLVVRAGAGAVAPAEVQPPGKRRMRVGDWLRGGGPRRGDRFL